MTSSLEKRIENITQDFLKRMNGLGVCVDIICMVEKESKRFHFFYEEGNEARITIEVSQLIDHLDLVKVRDDVVKNGVPASI